MSHETVRKATVGQALEISSVLQKKLSPIIKGMSFEEAQSWIGSKAEIGRFLRKGFQDKNMGSTDLILDWQDFYRRIFNKKVDFSGLRIPYHRLDYDRVLVVAEGLTYNMAFKACRERFRNVRTTNLDNPEKTVTHNDRMSDKQSYAIRARNRFKADEELKGKSADKICEADIPCMTLLERIVYELKFNDETGGGHLDLESQDTDHKIFGSVTLCAGSRTRRGGVPVCSWISHDPWQDETFTIRSGRDSDYTDTAVRGRQIVEA
jgi:hypothetical protein